MCFECCFQLTMKALDHAIRLRMVRCCTCPFHPQQSRKCLPQSRLELSSSICEDLRWSIETGNPPMDKSLSYASAVIEESGNASG